MISEIGVVFSTWLTFEDYSDLISTRWNVENDILLRGEFVTPERRRKWKILVNSDFCKIRQDSWPNWKGFWKKLDFATTTNPARSWPDCDITPRQLTLTGCFSFILILFLRWYFFHFFTFLAGTLRSKIREKVLQFLAQSWVLTVSFVIYSIQVLTKEV